MSFFDDLKKNAKKTSDFIVQKSKEVAQVTKKEVEIKKLQYEINNCYKKIGKLVYKQNTEDIDNSQKIEQICDAITGKYNKIEILNSEDCDIDEDSSDIYEDEEDEEEELRRPEKNDEGYFVMKFCKFCQVGNHPDAVKCVNCGRKFK